MTITSAALEAPPAAAAAVGANVHITMADLPLAILVDMLSKVDLRTLLNARASSSYLKAAATAAVQGLLAINGQMPSAALARLPAATRLTVTTEGVSNDGVDMDSFLLTLLDLINRLSSRIHALILKVSLGFDRWGSQPSMKLANALQLAPIGETIRTLSLQPGISAAAANHLLCELPQLQHAAFEVTCCSGEQQASPAGFVIKDGTWYWSLPTAGVTQLRSLDVSCSGQVVLDLSLLAGATRLTSLCTRSSFTQQNLPSLANNHSLQTIIIHDTTPDIDDILDADGNVIGVEKCIQWFSILSELPSLHHLAFTSMNLEEADDPSALDALAASTQLHDLEFNILMSALVQQQQALPASRSLMASTCTRQALRTCGGCSRGASLRSGS